MEFEAQFRKDSKLQPGDPFYRERFYKWVIRKLQDTQRKLKELQEKVNCKHEWGTDGQHSNEYCKKCFVSKPKELSWGIKPELVEASMRLFIETRYKEEFCGYLGMLVEKIKSGEADQDKLIIEINKEMKKRNL